MTTKKKAAQAASEPVEGEVMQADTIADRVNELHEAARSDAVSAVKKAIECGEVLLEVKASLKHGEFQQWIEGNCKFAYDTGKRYMKAAKAKSDGIPFSSLGELYGPKVDKGEPTERDKDDANRDKAQLTGLEKDIVELNAGLEGLQIPVMSAEQFVSKAGDAFLSEKAAQRLEWLVELFDTILNVKALPGK